MADLDELEVSARRMRRDTIVFGLMIDPDFTRPPEKVVAEIEARALAHVQTRKVR